MTSSLSQFSSIWCIVVAVERRPGDRLEPIAIVAVELAATAVVQIGVPKLRDVSLGETIRTAAASSSGL